MIPGLSNTSMLKPGNNYISQTLNGKYLNANPYTTALGQQVGGDAFNHVNSAFSLGGRTGSYGNKEAAAEGYAQAALPIEYQNYQNERALQGQAAGLLPGYQQAQNGANSTALGGIQLAGQLPYYGSQSLGTIGSLLGSYGTTEGKKPGGWLDSLLGAAASGASAGAMMSDRRLKTNIRKIREASDGLGVYDWNWKMDPDGPTVRGVIADEVEALRPWAFIPNFRGDYSGVNYAALGSLE